MLRCFAIALLLVAMPAAGRRNEPAAAPDKASQAPLARGDREIQKGRYAEALKAFEAARATNPGREVEERIARCQEQLGQFMEAAGTLRRLAEVTDDPFEADEYRKRAKALKVQAQRAIEAEAASLATGAAPPSAPAGAGPRAPEATKAPPREAAKAPPREDPPAGEDDADKGAAPPAKGSSTAAVEAPAGLAPYVKFFDYCKRKLREASPGKSGKVLLHLQAADGKTTATIARDDVVDAKFAGCLKSAARHVDAAAVGQGLEYEVDLAAAGR